MPPSAILDLYRPALDSVTRYIPKPNQNAAVRPTNGHSILHEQARERPCFVVQPLLNSVEGGIDLTHRIVEMIASELWRLRQGNDQLNWLEAERLFAQTIAELSEDKRTQPLPPRRALIHEHAGCSAAGAAAHAKRGARIANLAQAFV